VFRQQLSPKHKLISKLRCVVFFLIRIINLRWRCRWCSSVRWSAEFCSGKVVAKEKKARDSYRLPRESSISA
jgi:hypothetical protein